MPDPIADLDLYDAGVNADVTTQTADDSVSPVEVGGIGTDLSAILRVYLPMINNQTYHQGTSAPTSLPPFGADLDLYYQQLVSGFSLWRKESGVWILRVTMSFNLVENGILSGLRTFINGDTVTVEKGTWGIDNVQYSKATQTQFTVPAPDANFWRNDLIYADDSGAIGYTAGVASTTPAFPTPASGQLLVDYVVVPSVANGANPYLLSGGTNSAAVIIDVTSDANGEYDASGDNIPLWPKYNFFDKTTGDELPANYNSLTKTVEFLPPNTDFIGNFS